MQRSSAKLVRAPHAASGLFTLIAAAGRTGRTGRTVRSGRRFGSPAAAAFGGVLLSIDFPFTGICNLNI